MDQLLTTAIDRNAPAVLSLPSAGMVRHHRTRFLRAAAGSFWAESVAGERPLIDSLIASAEPVGVSFKDGRRAINFAGPILEVCDGLTLSAGVAVAAVRVARPAEVKAAQRRTDFRVAVHADDPLLVTVWRIGDHADLGDVPPTEPLATVVRDLSVGGVGLTLTAGGTVRDTDRLRLRVQYDAGGELVVEGACTTVRKLTPDDEPRLGVKFVGLQHELTGRKTLAGLAVIVGAIQRSELRRGRFDRRSA